MFPMMEGSAKKANVREGAAVKESKKGSKNSEFLENLQKECLEQLIDYINRLSEEFHVKTNSLLPLIVSTMRVRHAEIVSRDYSNVRFAGVTSHVRNVADNARRNAENRSRFERNHGQAG